MIGQFITNKRLIFKIFMLIGCDLFSSDLDFQTLSNKHFKKLKLRFKNIKFYNLDPNKKSSKNYSKISVYWGNRINLEILKKMKNLKWIHYGSTGINSDVLEYAKKQKIKVSNTKKMFDNSVAATAIAFIFSLSRGIHYSLYLRGRKELGSNFYNRIYKNMNDVFYKKILIVGYGNIGKKISKICKTMGMSIYAIKSNVKKGNKYFYDLKNLDSVVKNKDFVINLLPKTKLTQDIFNMKIFKNMSKKSFFINLGRGEAVNEKDLEKAIIKKEIGGAALDVIKNEPLKKNFSLLKYNNVIVTPHIAGINTVYKKKQVDLFGENLKRFLSGKKLIFSMKKDY